MVRCGIGSVDVSVMASPLLCSLKTFVSFLEDLLPYLPSVVTAASATAGLPMVWGFVKQNAGEGVERG